MKRLALCLLSMLFGLGILAGCSEDDPPPPRKLDQIVIIPDAATNQDK